MRSTRRLESPRTRSLRDVSGDKARGELVTPIGLAPPVGPTDIRGLMVVLLRVVVVGIRANAAARLPTDRRKTTSRIDQGPARALAGLARGGGLPADHQGAEAGLRRARDRGPAPGVRRTAVDPLGSPDRLRFVVPADVRGPAGLRSLEFGNTTDDRARVLLIHGPPAFRFDRQVPEFFNPLEIWGWPYIEGLGEDVVVAVLPVRRHGQLPACGTAIEGRRVLFDDHGRRGEPAAGPLGTDRSSTAPRYRCPDGDTLMNLIDRRRAVGS